jgi:hypothetical protein
MGFDETDISIKAGIIKIKELACSTPIKFFVEVW